jgi:hypothetical protein
MLDGIRPELRALPFRLIDQEAVRNLRDELLPKKAAANLRRPLILLRKVPAMALPTGIEPVFQP